MKQSIPLFLLSALISACGRNSTTHQEQQPATGITAEEIAGYDKTLSSDAFLGRKPFTEGEKKTVPYLVDEFKKLGLQPGNGDSYTQDVPLVEIDGTPSDAMEVNGGGRKLTLHLGDEFVVVTKREQPEINVQNSELIFCGFGIVAPEYGWNDYAGLDMKGKTAVVLVNDPGFGGQDEDFFKGDTMTYYGRWTYKYEEAQLQGAEGILIVHETGAAGYPWSVVESGWSGGQMQLRSKDGNPTKPAVQGWISLDAAKKLFGAAGLDFDAESKKARTKEFKPVFSPGWACLCISRIHLKWMSRKTSLRVSKVRSGRMNRSYIRHIGIISASANRWMATLFTMVLWIMVLVFHVSFRSPISLHCSRCHRNGPWFSCSSLPKNKACWDRSGTAHILFTRLTRRSLI